MARCCLSGRGIVVPLFCILAWFQLDIFFVLFVHMHDVEADRTHVVVIVVVVLY